MIFIYNKENELTRAIKIQDDKVNSFYQLTNKSLIKFNRWDGRNHFEYKIFNEEVLLIQGNSDNIFFRCIKKNVPQFELPTTINHFCVENNCIKEFSVNVLKIKRDT